MYDKNYSSIYDYMYGIDRYKKDVQTILNIFADYDEINFNTLLEIGCGTGGHLKEWSKYFQKVIGYEPSKEMFELAKKHREIPNIKLKNGALCDVCEEPALADLVVMNFNVVGYFLDSNNLLMGLRSLGTVLKEGCKIYLDYWPEIDMNNYTAERVISLNKGFLRRIQTRDRISEDIVKIKFDFYEGADFMDRVFKSEHIIKSYSHSEVRQLIYNAGFSNPHFGFEGDTNYVIAKWSNNKL